MESQESFDNNGENAVKTEIIAEIGTIAVQEIMSISYAGHSEKILRIIKPVNEFRANLPA